MLKSHVFTVCHGKFALSSEARHVWNDSRELSSLYGCSSNSIDISNLRSRGWCGKLHVNRGREEQVPVNKDECMDAFERRVDSGEMAETTVDRVRMVDCGDRCDESAQGPMAGKYNAVNPEAVRSPDAWALDRHENFSYQEMMERWEFLKHLPHKYVSLLYPSCYMSHVTYFDRISCMPFSSKRVMTYGLFFNVQFLV